MSKYAEGTSVSVAASQREITQTLDRYGASSVAIAYEPGRAVIAFIAHERHIRLTIDLPTDWRDFQLTARKIRRSQGGAEAAMAAEVRRRWRALALVIKAKLEVAASGIAEFESEFLAYMVLPGGATVAEHVLPGVAEAYETGEVPALLPPARKAIEGSGS